MLLEEQYDPFIKIKDLPQIVYKYRDWDNQNHRRVLQFRELYFASPSQFNDPFDCSIPIAYHKLSEPELADKYFPDVVSRYFSHLSAEEQREEVAKLKEKFKNQTANEIHEMDQQMRRSLADGIGVLSLTTVFDNILMWSHYSNSHTGFCIGFFSEILFNNPRHFGSGGRVIYAKEYPVILPTEPHHIQMIKQTYLKSDIWKYEDEYRITKMLKPYTVAEFPENAVAEILIGYRMTEENKTSLIALCREQFPRAIIKQATLIPYQFRLSFEAIP